MEADGTVEIADFSFSIEPKRFRINDDVFECAPSMPLGVMAHAANIKLDVKSFRDDPDHALDPLIEFFREIFIGDSAVRFEERLKSKERPIGLEHILKIVPWLLEVYGLRPTEPSSNSSTSHENGGTTSTAGASDSGSNHSDSPHVEDSTSFTTTPAFSPSVS